MRHFTCKLSSVTALIFAVIACSGESSSSQPNDTVTAGTTEMSEPVNTSAGTDGIDTTSQQNAESSAQSDGASGTTTEQTTDIEGQSGEQADEQADEKTDEKTGEKTDEQTDEQADEQTDEQADEQAGEQAEADGEAGAEDTQQDGGTGSEDQTDVSFLPVLFVHGPSGSASQFESQAQRFMANGYPLKYLDTLEYDSSVIMGAMTNPIALPGVINDPDFQARLAAKIDKLLSDCGAEKVNLICLSITSLMCSAFMETDDNDQKVAHYVQTDCSTGIGIGPQFAGVDTLALWSMMFSDTNASGSNVTNDHDDAQGHIEVATSAVSFEKIYEFFNSEAPPITDIPESKSNLLSIAGKANIFPYNVGADTTRLSIYEVDRSTGLRVEGTDPIVENLDIDTSGDWGPFEIKKGVAYEFFLINETVSSDEQHFYREPFYADDYFIRLNLGRPGEGISSHLNRDAAHTNLMIGRDKEMWGDQGDGNDLLFINDDEDSVLTPDAAAQSRMLSTLFLSDQNGNKDSDYTTIDDVTQVVFISGTDYYIPAAAQPDLSDLSTISIELISRGSDGVSQIINAPNWPADRVRTVSVQFRDFVQ